MHPFYPRTRSLARTDTHTHTPPPKFRFSARSGWERGRSKGCPDNGDRKSKCQGLRVYLAEGAAGAAKGTRLPQPQGGLPPLPTVLLGCFEAFPSIPLSSYPLYLPPDFSSNFLLSLSLDLSGFCPPPPPFTPLRGPEGTSDFFLQQVGVIHIKHFTTTHQEK